jgi:hypothetical protein
MSFSIKRLSELGKSLAYYDNKTSESLTIIWIINFTFVDVIILGAEGFAKSSDIRSIRVLALQVPEHKK